jgi:hypothetical protein
MGTTLARLIHDLDQLGDDLTIYAEGGPDAGPDAPAVAVLEPDDDTVPREAAGLDYFLEVDIAKEVVAVWSEWRGDRLPTPAEALHAVAHYARNDAFLPIDDG